MLVFLLLHIVACTRLRFPPEVFGTRFSQSATPMLFSQTLDHFDPLSSETFSQKAWIEDKYFNPNASNGPIGLLYICGESACGGLPEDPIVEYYAKNLQAFAATIEHRYFGDSCPFDKKNLKVSELQYLTSRQALADLVNFKVSLSHDGTVPPNTKWIIIGGSYSGALSAWMRLKYPHEFVGALASSGVVNTILDFYEYDLQVGKSVGSECASQMRNATVVIEKLVADPKTRNSTMQQFDNAQSMRTVDFFAMLGDTTAAPVQYGYQADLCACFSPTTPLVTSMVNAFAFYQKVFGAKPSDYDIKTLEIPDNSGARMWTFMTCAEMGYFQTAPQSGVSIRSTMLDLQYSLDICERAYGIQNTPQLVANSLEYYGGTKILDLTSNIYFTNGSQDPWQRATVAYPSSQKRSGFVKNKVNMVHCANCGHCVDIERNGCPGGCHPPTEHQAALVAILVTMKEWIA